jgi:hypothetical protein
MESITSVVAGQLPNGKEIMRVITQLPLTEGFKKMWLAHWRTGKRYGCRLSAVKMAQRQKRSPSTVERFRREAKRLGLLENRGTDVCPNWVPVFPVPVPEGAQTDDELHTLVTAIAAVVVKRRARTGSDSLSCGARSCADVDGRRSWWPDVGRRT